MVSPHSFQKPQTQLICNLWQKQFLNTGKNCRKTLNLRVRKSSATILLPGRAGSLAPRLSYELTTA